ncbi:MAG: NUDIX hydrolase [Candidatus Pacebacteria bacterium]|nr:NUDIX hydrolase [Candidatus Paceibacterota bacterium]PIR63767.1 MAG: NUDIX hydrolase [Candidatus Pacebacteria bacterium CG10_big_fil_rev_8_21_14_0_10_40_26]PIZ78553.1 MAG: NUDIX hydrolase [Candidatus Pacebacteria bacterium CG_4_10_14_0_2_um_filter_40_20]PJA69404.1 MAG: NUDIX hydrolase [Candidatus Pacebacteria bacterium CG_4_9_14_3_um_filter_40_12]PJC41421.1 MAG: NUDIX hydrolase [Candidatus Pacebacteria bacterium CG_4_9_14_0_2_um_filter_40_15]
MLRKWKLLSSKIGYSHPFFKVREDHVITPTGLEINDYTVWESGDVAQVIPVLPNGKLLLVEQYKHGLGEMIVEFPGGFIENAELPEVAAFRELSEETGYTSTDVHKLGTFIHHPTKESGKLHLYVAKNIQKQAKKLAHDSTEDIRLLSVGSDELFKKIQSGEVLQSGSMLGLLLYLQEEQNAH